MKKILWVDDDVSVFDGALNRLREASYIVVAVPGVDEAVEALKTGDFDLLLLDVMMDPGKIFSDIETMGGLRTGIFFAQYVRLHFPDLPIAIFSSANLSQYDDSFLFRESIEFYRKYKFSGAKFVELIDQISGRKVTLSALDAVELKPGVFGVKLDVRKFFEFIDSKRRR